MRNYISSVVNKYGDLVNIKSDSQTLKDIQDRQGADFIIDALAEYTGTSANKFKLDDTERMRIRDALVNALKEALNERL